MDCSFSRSIYSIFAYHYKLPLVQHCTVISFLDFWFKGISVCSYFKYFPLFFFWCIWKQRNRCIFDNKQPSSRALLKQIEDLIHLYPVPQKKRSRRLVDPGPLISYPCGFFDGAAAENIGGAGFVILMDASYSINFSLGCGRSTNTRAELLALWAILMVSKQMGIPLITIFGDSLVIIS